MAGVADLTVVVPTHDRDELLRQALASVLAQTEPVSRVVVCDDRGSPLTRQVVEEVAAGTDVPVDYQDVRHLDAGTAGASRNAGAASVATPLVAFLDDDDTWAPTFVARTRQALVAEGSDLVVTWMAPTDPRYRMTAMRPGLRARDVVSRNPGLTGSNFVVRTEAFRRLGGFDETLPVSNDKDFLLRALQAGLRYSVVAERLVTYRVHGSGQLTDRTPRRAAGLRRYAAKHEALLTPTDRRVLRAQLSSVLRVADGSPVRRLGHTVRLAWDRALLTLLEDAR